MISRRRFLSIGCALTLAPTGPATAALAPLRWQGVAMGAPAEMTLYGPRDLARRMLAGALRDIAMVERFFSLHDPDSMLSRLNREGYLNAPPPLFLRLLRQARQVSCATEGLFDPGVQPLWRALAEGRAGLRTETATGWSGMTLERGTLRLPAGGGLTFNGIAQGFATDLVAERMRRAGAARVLVDLGEIRGLGGPWRIGIEDPVQGHLSTRNLADGAIASSSPAALMLAPDQGHIIGPPGAPPLWSTVTVEARSASLADGLSTALVFASETRIPRMRARLPGIGRITLIDGAGNLRSL